MRKIRTDTTGCNKYSRGGCYEVGPTRGPAESQSSYTRELQTTIKSRHQNVPYDFSGRMLFNGN